MSSSKIGLEGLEDFEIDDEDIIPEIQKEQKIGLEGLEDFEIDDEDIVPEPPKEKKLVLENIQKEYKKPPKMKKFEEVEEVDQIIKKSSKKKPKKSKSIDLEKEKQELDELMYGEALKEKEIFKAKEIKEKFLPATHTDIQYDAKCMNKLNVDIFTGKKKKPLDDRPLELREHQKLVINHLINHRGILAIHSTGTGKTLTAIGAINCVLDTFNDPNDPDYIKRVIVVLPKSVQSDFEKDCKRFGLYDITKYKSDLTPEEKLMYKKWKKIEIYTFAALVNAIKAGKIKCKNSFIIIDEVHNLKAEFKKGEFQRGTLGKVEGTNAYHVARCAARAKKVLLLTATPIMNTPSEIINYISMIDGRKLQFGVDAKAFAKEIYENEDIFNQYFCCKVSMYLIEKDENYPLRLEDKIEKFIMDPKYYDQYRRIEADEFEKVLDRMSWGSNAFQNAVRRASVALDKEDSPKIQWIYNFLLNEIQKDKKTIIYSQFIEYGLDSLRRLLDKNDIPYAIISGQIHSSLRKKFISKFNDDKIKVLLISKAGGEGIDLKGVRNVILMESNWHEAGEEQVIGRAIRYKSHEHLPPEERNVQVIRLWMVKPSSDEEMNGYSEELQKFAKNDIKLGRLAVDETLYYKSYGIKRPAIKEFYKKLDKISIENTKGQCICKLSPKSPSVQEIVNEDFDEAFKENPEQDLAQQEDFKQELEKELEKDVEDDKFRKIKQAPITGADEIKKAMEKDDEELDQKDESQEEVKYGYYYIAPGKSSLAIEDVELTLNQFKNLTGLFDNKFYREYYDKFKKYGEVKTKNKQGKTIVLEVYKNPDYEDKNLKDILDEDDLKMLEDATKV